MFMENLKGAAEHVRTLNGAVAHGDSGNKLLNLFGIGGAARKLKDSEIMKLVMEAFNEDRLLTLKCLFYIRDVRGGQGEREFFRKAIKILLSVLKMEEGLAVIAEIPEYGRWDDMWAIIPMHKLHYPLREQLMADSMNMAAGESVSVLAKWLPSINGGTESVKQAKELCKLWKMPHREYRRQVADLRKYLNVVERQMCAGKWHEIIYSQVPSQASRIYRKAFAKHDEARYNAFIARVESGEEKINTKTLFPYEILQSYGLVDCGAYTLRLTTEDKTLEALWKNLPDYCEGCTDNSLVMADTSGSMRGVPMTISLSLAIYMAERNRGAFKDYFMTFSSTPKMVKLKGETLRQKVANIEPIVENTNITAAFEMILDFALSNNATQEELPKTVFIISDMQFDMCQSGKSYHTTFDNLKRMFAERGYTIPKIVFWNVNAAGGVQFPVRKDEINTILVSGASPSTFKQVMSGEFTTPYQYMLSVLNSERYARIKV